MLTIRQFESAESQVVIELWRRCGLVRSTNDPQKDILRKSKVRPDLFLVGEDAGRVVATVMAGYEGHRGWINYLAVSPEYQKQGYGRNLMAKAEERLRLAECPKINLQVRRSNRDVLAFYSAIGFVEDDVVSLGKRLEHDDSSA